MNAIASGAFERSDVKAGGNGNKPCQHHHRFALLEKLAKASQDIGGKYGHTPNTDYRWLPRAGWIGLIVRMGRHIGQPGSPEQVVFLFARWKPRGVLSDLSSERCDAIPKGGGLFKTAVHDIAPIIRLVATRAMGRMIPHLDLGLDQLFERLRNLPFLIALNVRSQRAGFSYCF
jgi:hypothetical protein